jgi:restriction endonuclease S subunit
MITAVDCTIVRFKSLVKAKYFVFITLSEEYQTKVNSNLSGATRQRISKGNLLEIEIPIPPSEIQEQIVCELDKYQTIISGAKQIVANWKPKFHIDPEWEKVRLGEIATNNDSKRRPVTKSDRTIGQYPYY